jgi:hypothetical protein
MRLLKPFAFALLFSLAAVIAPAPTAADPIANRSQVISTVSSTTDGNLVLFSGTTGKRIKDGGTLSSIGGVPTSLTISTTSPLSGGGDLSTNRTLTCTTCVTTSRSIGTTAPLTGGGALSGDLTLAMPAATASVNGYMTSAYATKVDGIAAGANVVGATSSTDNTMCRADGTSGHTQFSGWILTDADRMQIPSTSGSGILFANTADLAADNLVIDMGQTSANVATIRTNAGTGTARNLVVGAATAANTTYSTAGTVSISGSGATSAGPYITSQTGTTMTSTSNVQVVHRSTGTCNQASGTGGCVAHQSLITQTACGSAGCFSYIGTKGATDTFKVNTDGTPTFVAATAPPAGGSAVVCMFLSSSNVAFCTGSGAPTFSAAQGSLYTSTTGGAGARLYVNTSGSTTWTAATSP